jgi:hypothetical protein
MRNDWYINLHIKLFLGELFVARTKRKLFTLFSLHNSFFFARTWDLNLIRARTHQRKHIKTLQLYEENHSTCNSQSAICWFKLLLACRHSQSTQPDSSQRYQRVFYFFIFLLFIHETENVTHKKSDFDSIPNFVFNSITHHLHESTSSQWILAREIASFNWELLICSAEINRKFFFTIFFLLFFKAISEIWPRRTYDWMYQFSTQYNDWRLSFTGAEKCFIFLSLFVRFAPLTARENVFGKGGK